MQFRAGQEHQVTRIRNELDAVGDEDLVGLLEPLAEFERIRQAGAPGRANANSQADSLGVGAELTGDAFSGGFGTGKQVGLALNNQYEVQKPRVSAGGQGLTAGLEEGRPVLGSISPGILESPTPVPRSAERGGHRRATARRPE